MAFDRPVRIHFVWRSMHLVGVYCCLVASSYAAGISGDIHTNNQPLQGGGAATNGYFAFSQIQSRPGFVFGNQRTRLETFRPGAVLTQPLVQTPGVLINVGPRQYGRAPGPPTVGIDNIPKPVAPTTLQIGVSESGGTSSATSVFFGEGIYDVGNKTIRGDAFGRRGFVGAAAGAAFDPFVIDGDVPDYQYIVSASLQLDRQGDFGGLIIFAADQRLTDPDTFYERGQPLDEMLWFLRISANDVLDSLSDLLDPTKLEIEFRIADRSILNPIDAGPDGMFLTSDDRPIADSEIAARVRTEFTLSNNTAILSSFPLFPSESPDASLRGRTVYLVDGPIQYGVGVNAGLTTAIPEPSTLALLAVATLAWVSYARRNRRGSRNAPPAEEVRRRHSAQAT